MLDSARISTTQTVAYTGTAANLSNAFGSQTRQIRIVADSACHYMIDTTPTTATTSHPFLPSNWIEYVTVNPGEKISVVRAGTDGLVTATSGTMWVTELT